MAAMVRNLVSGSAHQQRKRAVVKTLCYRLLMILVTVVVAWIFVGDVADAVNIGIAANVIKTVTYYGYERLWDRITWGLTTA